MRDVRVMLGGIFLAIGLVFTAIGSFAGIAMGSAPDNAVSAVGTVTGLSGGRPVVKFLDQNGTRHRITGSVSSSPPAYSRGERVDVLYDPARPGGAVIDGFLERTLFPLIFGGIGLIFAIVGGVLLCLVWRRRKVIERLKTSGFAIQGTFLECYRDTSTKVNGRSPYRVVAQATHPATGKLESFKSEPIWVDPTDQLEGKPIKILIDPAKPKAHFVDLSHVI